ncbi:hypothetical protein [Winogradskyella sp.]|uniref:hypothetical protein n=1 Tax=Winogradskyella sp. TaxID=1883156 RepID=UPI0025F8EC10|nr:hypothetical protein [Winogradskyella sp.]MBT8243767.1 hypothetical protein [Winogradskyella sp.]
MALDCWHKFKCKQHTYYKTIIQRYDGQSFYTLELPEFYTSVKPEVGITKRQDGQIYAKYKSNNEVQLFSMKVLNMLRKIKVILMRV